MKAKRFIVVQINGQFYEIERPYGAAIYRVLVAWSECGKPERVWTEAVA